MGERRPCKAEAVGSIPISSILRVGCATFDGRWMLRSLLAERVPVGSEFFDNCIWVTGLKMKAHLVAAT